VYILGFISSRKPALNGRISVTSQTTKAIILLLLIVLSVFRLFYQIKELNGNKLTPVNFIGI
jgi:hypothetical protein